MTGRGVVCSAPQRQLAKGADVNQNLTDGSLSAWGQHSSLGKRFRNTRTKKIHGTQDPFGLVVEALTGCGHPIDSDNAMWEESAEEITCGLCLKSCDVPSINVKGGEVRETFHAWAAGVLDGEGCIMIQRNRLGHSLTVSVNQSWNDGPPPMLLRLQEVYGGALNMNRSQPPGQHGKDGIMRYRQNYIWAVVARRAEAMLRAIAPYVVQKADQLALAMEYRERATGRLRFEEAARYRAELQAMKRR
jgi:hypothetical protein